MSSIILEAKSLTKEYKQTLALDHINLQIKKGKIYGFIGQNGAGKTTFLRLVTGLAFPTSGTLSLWGNSGTEELQKQRKRIGSMIETPALFPSMTAYQNMEVQRIQRGIPDKSVIKRTLDMVGLQDTGKKSVRNFSLGMRQRLGIAIALLNTPELLILDEPINGLDPAGIVEIRNLLKILNKEYREIYSREVTREIPNSETISAINEVQQMKQNPSLGKSYTDIDKMMIDLTI